MLRTLLDGRRWLILAAVVGALAGVTVAKLMSRTFKSTLVLKYEGSAPLPGAPPVAPTTVVNIAVETCRSQKVLAQFKQRMAIPGPIAVVARTFEVNPEPENGLLRLTASAPSAARAALLANTLGEILLDRLNDLDRERFVAARASLLERSSAQEQELARVRRAYDDFRESHGIADLSTEQEEGITSAAELRAQRDLGEAEIRALEARVAQLRRDSSHTPRMVAMTSSASSDRMELQRLESELTSARASLSEDHPRVRALELQVAGLRRRLDQGHAETSALTYGQSGQYAQIQTSLSAAESDLAAARERMKGLRELASRAQTRVTEFSQIEGEAATLLAQVRVNEQLAAELQDQLARVANSASRQGDAGFRVFSAAQAPEFSEPNSKKLMVAAAIPTVIVLITCVILLFRELRGLRIKTARELAYWGRGPVVASTTWPRDLHGLDDLIGDMDDCAPAAAGRTLVVGINDAQSVLAQTIASRLGEDWRSSVISMQGGSAPSWRPSATPKSAPPGTQRSAPPSARDEGSFSKKVTLVGYSTPIPEREPEAPSRDTYTGHDSPTPEPLHVPPTAITTRYRPGGLPTGLVPYRDVEPWDGPLDGPSLRRAARLADRVAVVVPAGACSVLDVASIQTRLGRTHGIGFILVDVAAEFARLTDRSGPVDAFWSSTRID